MEFHDAANIFPIDEDSIGELAKDIRDNGQQVPIELCDGKIIDGRRRWMACEKANVTPKTRIVNPSDPVSYVLSLNLHRRHLTASQRAMVGARAREVYDKQAKERQKATLKRGNEKPVKEKLPERESGQSRDKVGDSVGVSGRYIDHATMVLNNAEPEVIQAVDEGRMSVEAASIVSVEEAEVQRQEAANPKGKNAYRKQKAEKDNGPADDSTEDTNGKKAGVGVIRANEAINSLSRIPKNDPLRKRGFQIVTDWIRRNK